ncbi:RNA polymerase sigma-70 factor, ECF subfamily [Paenibacillaceae bacterium GAS479]|nr:RNA polymerase sigma-70 factor, ECF subfamily [Paenibacillaceae bacterium GAS479]
MDELRLIKKIRRSGDRAAADELVRRYYDEIHGFVRKQILNSDVALDLTQEIFISMLRTIGHYDAGRGAGFRTWLYRIAANKLVDWFRSRAYRTMVQTIPLDEVEPIDETDLAQLLENRDFTEQICAFVSGLPPDTQIIFRLHLFGGHTFREIAGIIGLAEGSVKSRYYRLIHLLRKEFADI